MNVMSHMLPRVPTAPGLGTRKTLHMQVEDPVVDDPWAIRTGHQRFPYGPFLVFTIV